MSVGMLFLFLTDMLSSEHYKLVCMLLYCAVSRLFLIVPHMPIHYVWYGIYA